MEAQVNGFGKGGNDLGRVVSGGDEIDVVATQLLELEHGLRQLGGGVASSEMTDIVILAEDTPKVAVS